MSTQFVHRQIQNSVQGEVDENRPFICSTRHFTVCPLICEGRNSGVTLPMGKLRLGAEQESSPFPRATQQTRVLFPLSLAAFCLRSGKASCHLCDHTGQGHVYSLCPSRLSIPFPITCLVHVAVFMQECRPALRSQEIRRQPWACLGTCHPFAVPVGDMIYLVTASEGSVYLRAVEGSVLPVCLACLSAIVLCS